MRLPRKIDDRLKDAIVNISFVPAVPSETVIGYAHALLNGLFDPIVSGQFPAFRLHTDGVTIDPRTVYFLSKDKQFRIDIDGQSVTFNMAQGYAGWAAYRTVISSCLTALLTGNLIRQVNRLGIRYISQFNGIRIADAIDMQLHIQSLPDDRRGQLRLEFMRNDLFTILTLVDGYPIEAPDQITSTNNFFSLIDVDIIKSYPLEQTVDIDALLSHMDTAHHEQKMLFFGLLKENFLKTLNPHY